MRRVLGLIAASTLLGAALATALGGPESVSAASPVSLGASVAETKEVMIPGPAGPGINIHQSVGATDLLTGRQGWVFGIVNSAGLPVTDPAITVDSGWSPSLFPGLMAPLEGGCPSTITRQGSAFPYTWADASLPLTLDDNCYLSSNLPGVRLLDNPPGVMATEQDMMWQGGDVSSVAPPISFRPGYDSFRDVDTTTVSPGGTQHVTVGFTVRDPSIALIQVQLSSFMTPELITGVTYPEGVPDCTAASDPGATCLWWWDLGPRPDPASVAPHSEWNLKNPVPGQQYEFIATFTNEGDAPVSMIPDARLTTPRTFASQALITDTSVRVMYPDLDGARPGSGTVDFTIGAGQAADWTATTIELPWVIYGGGNLSYGTTITTSTQAMDGDLKVPQGSTLLAGYDFTMPGTHPAANVSFLGAHVTFNATCASGTPGTATIVVNIPDQAYVDPANSSAWYPSGDQNAASTYQGSTTVPSFCDPGSLVRLQKGGTFSTNVSSTDTKDKVNVRWHYKDGTGGGWSGTYSVIPS